MATALIPDDFREFLRLLNAHRVEYLVVGGYAVGYHGYPRATADLDVWVAIRPSNAERLLTVLRAFGFGETLPPSDVLLKQNQIVRMGFPPFRIELMTTISGVEFDACHRNRVRARVDDVDVDFISLEDLRTNKPAAGLYKDLDDLGHLA